MLGKLLKHELKSTGRLLLPVHALVLLFGVIGRLLVTIANNTQALPDVLVALLAGTYVLMIIVAAAGTSFYLAIRFYRHLFTDQGFLAFTLPVTPGQHLLCKTISGSIWKIINMLCIGSSILLIVFNARFVRMFHDYFFPALQREAGIDTSVFAWIMIIGLLIYSFAEILMYYVCIAIGQLFSKHRILCSIVAYFVITFALQIISTVPILVLISFSAPEYVMYPGDLMDLSTMTMTYTNIYLVITLILTIIYYVVTHRIMTRRLNLI